jgi:hypothetical protein
MIDPGALGTLLIGLGAIEAEARVDQPRRHAAVARPHRTGAVRLAVARALRRAAAALERPAIREVAR